MIRLPIQRIARALACAIGIAGIAACGGGGGGGTPITAPGPISKTVGGSLVGLSGSGLVLQNNAGDDLAVSSSSTSFSFARALATGAAYSVTVKTQPGSPIQVCSVTNGAGTVGSINITDIVIICSGGGFTVGGTVSGLGAGKSVGLRLLSDFTPPNVTTVNANGAFTMGVTLAANSEFELIVSAQPAGQTCSVANGAGTVAAANITNVAVTCADNSASARNWTPAQPIFTDTDPADADTVGATSVGFDAAGHAIAVWESSSIGSAGIDTAFSRYTPGAGWSAPELVSPFVALSGTDVVERRLTPRIAVAANGNAVVVWRRRNSFDIGDDVAASFYTVGSGWSPPEIIWATVPDQFDGADHLRIAIDSSNNVLVVFDAGGYVRYARYSSGAGWSAPGSGGAVSSVAPIFSLRPELAMNHNGQAVAVWEQRNLVDSVARFDLWSSRYDVASDTWSAPQPVETDFGGVYYGKSVVIDAGGTATAVWSQYDGTRMRVYSNRLTGSSWATPTIVESGNSGPNGNAYDPRAAIDGNGNVMAMWIQNDDAGGHYVANRYVPGSGWGLQRHIGEYGAVGFTASDTEIALVSNAAGDAVAIWTFYREIGAENVLGPDHVFANEYNAATGLWGVANIIDAPTGGASLPSVAIDAAGNAAAVWKNSGPTAPGISGSVFR